MKRLVDFVPSTKDYRNRNMTQQLDFLKDLREIERVERENRERQQRLERQAEKNKTSDGRSSASTYYFVSLVFCKNFLSIQLLNDVFYFFFIEWNNNRFIFYFRVTMDLKLFPNTKKYMCPKTRYPDVICALSL